MLNRDSTDRMVDRYIDSIVGAISISVWDLETLLIG